MRLSASYVILQVNSIAEGGGAKDDGVDVVVVEVGRR